MSELSAFARAFEARREQAVARLLEISKEQMPQAFAHAPESFRERVGRDSLQAFTRRILARPPVILGFVPKP